MLRSNSGLARSVQKGLGGKMKNGIIMALLFVILLMAAYIQRGSYHCQGLDVVIENFPQETK